MSRKFFPLALFLALLVPRIFSEELSGDSDGDAQDDMTSSQEIRLPHVYTYIDSPSVEQRQVLTGEDIRSLHVSSLPELLSAAGMQVLSYGAYGLLSKPSIRGFTDETVAVVVDGVAANNAMNGTFDFTTLSPDQIERIEIVRGGFSEDVSAEGAVGGIIYITTRKQSLGNAFRTDAFTKTYFNKSSFLDTTCGSFDYAGQVAENSFLKTTVRAAFARNEFLFKAYDGSVRPRENSSVSDGNLNASLTRYFGSGNSWFVTETFYGGYKNIAGAETSAVPGVQQDYNNKLTAGLSFPSLAHVARTDITLSAQSYNELYDEADTRSEHYLTSGILTARADFLRRGFFSQSAGMRLTLDYLKSTDDGTHLLFSGALKETSKFQLNDVLSVSVPLAFVFSGENMAVIPKLGVMLSLKIADVIMSAYRMVQFPVMNDLYWAYDGRSSGNPDLKAESGWGAEISFNSCNAVLPFSLCVYSNYYSQKIQWTFVDGINTPMNVASAFYLGANISVARTFFNLITLRANAEYLYTRLLDKNNTLTYGKRIMYTPDLVWAVTAVLKSRYADFSVEANFTGKRYVSNLNVSYLEPYLLLNASAELSLWHYVRPYMRLDNILNADYESVPGYPMPGIALTAGARCVW